MRNPHVELMSLLRSVKANHIHLFLTRLEVYATEVAPLDWKTQIADMVTYAERLNHFHIVSAIRALLGKTVPLSHLAEMYFYQDQSLLQREFSKTPWRQKFLTHLLAKPSIDFDTYFDLIDTRNDHTNIHAVLLWCLNEKDPLLQTATHKILLTLSKWFRPFDRENVKADLHTYLATSKNTDRLIRFWSYLYNLDKTPHWLNRITRFASLIGRNPKAKKIIHAPHDVFEDLFAVEPNTILTDYLENSNFHRGVAGLIASGLNPKSIIMTFSGNKSLLLKWLMKSGWSLNDFLLDQWQKHPPTFMNYFRLVSASHENLEMLSELVIDSVITERRIRLAFLVHKRQNSSFYQIASGLLTARQWSVVRSQLDEFISHHPLPLEAPLLSASQLAQFTQQTSQIVEDIETLLSTLNMKLYKPVRDGYYAGRILFPISSIMVLLGILSIICQSSINCQMNDNKQLEFSLPSFCFLGSRHLTVTPHLSSTTCANFDRNFNATTNEFEDVSSGSLLDPYVSLIAVGAVGLVALILAIYQLIPIRKRFMELFEPFLIYNLRDEKNADAISLLIERIEHRLNYLQQCEYFDVLASHDILYHEISSYMNDIRGFLKHLPTANLFTLGNRVTTINDKFRADSLLMTSMQALKADVKTRNDEALAKAYIPLNESLTGLLLNESPSPAPQRLETLKKYLQNGLLHFRPAPRQSEQLPLLEAGSALNL